MLLGAPGKIVVEGPIVGRCHVADSQETQERFIACRNGSRQLSIDSLVDSTRLAI